LIRNTFRLASRKDSDALKRDLKPIYTAVNATAFTPGDGPTESRFTG
jgi:transposase-like protein